MIRFLCLVSNLIFLDVCIVGDIFFDMSLKSGFFKSCIFDDVCTRTTWACGSLVIIDTRAQQELVADYAESSRR